MGMLCWCGGLEAMEGKCRWWGQRQQCKRYQPDGIKPPSRTTASLNQRNTQYTGMTKPVFWWCWVAVVLCSLLATALANEEEVAPASAQDALGLLASLQQASEGSSNELRKMATMYELLQLAALQQQQQRQRFSDLEEREREEGEELPVPLPLQAKLTALQDKEEYLKDKRGSYMSLCHFKICNMGRKRNSYWNTWGRN